MLSPLDVIVIAGAAIVLFGGSQIPKIARSLGEGIKEFKKAIKETKDDEKPEAAKTADQAVEPKSQDPQESTAPRK